MRAWIAVSTLALMVAACAGSETREEEPWGTDDPADSTEAFDEQLREKRLRDAESMEQAQAVAARLAAKRGKTLEETTGSSRRSRGRAVTRAVPQALDREPCPPDAKLKYTCRCTGRVKPAWAENQGRAWQKPDSYWYAVGKAPVRGSTRMASDRAHGRALAKIAEALRGQPGFSGLPDQQVKGLLKGAESREVHHQGKSILALARYKAGAHVPKAVIEAKCPEVDQAPYACDCPAGSAPAWLDLQAWRGEDGFAYAVGGIEADAEQADQRIANRANRNLLRFLSGLTLQAGPVQGGGKAIESWTIGSIDTKRVQKVAEQVHGKDKVLLVRFWIGE